MNNPLEKNATKFVRMNTHLCQACWKCYENCPQHVIDRINLPFHKHAVIKHPEDCRGCLKCAIGCPNRAITVIPREPKPVS